jgi:spore coat protein U domain-containing protein, fimbrial subunit CupE1/2/3/6
MVTCTYPQERNKSIGGRMKKNLLMLLFLLACLTTSRVAMANLFGSLTVNASAVDGCSSVSTSPVNFGPISTGTFDGVGQITVTCLAGVSYGIRIGASDFDCNQDRLMQGQGTATGFTIPYKLYQDSQRTVLWGYTFANNCNQDNDIGNGSPQQHTVYGRATPFSIGAPGNYEDTLQVEIGF